MANTNVSHSEAKAICDHLECSPSQHDDSGHYGGAPNITVTAKSSSATVLKTHGSPTTEFKMTDRGRPIPNFKGQFAKHAKEV